MDVKRAWIRNGGWAAAICALFGIAALQIYRVRGLRAEQTRTEALSVMGRVANIADPVDLKAFSDFTRETGAPIRFAPSLGTVTEQIELALNLFHHRSPEPDLMDMDVIWAQTLADYLLDLRPYFPQEIADLAPELLRTFTVDGRVVALPTFLDAGVLYYRGDLLGKYGFRAPPETWEQLERMAAVIQGGERRAGQRDFWGYVWQGGAYEALTCNALEWQASAGAGEILDASGAVCVRHARFRDALLRARRWIGTISPPGEPAFGEEDSLNFYRAGKAAFMRNWIGEYAGLKRSGGVVGTGTEAAAMPGARGAFGGSGTGVSRFSSFPERSVALLRRIISEQTQRFRAREGGYVPTRAALLRDSQLMSHTALKDSMAGRVVRNLAIRPALQAGANYERVSQAYYTAIHDFLRGAKPIDPMLANLEADIARITAHRQISH